MLLDGPRAKSSPALNEPHMLQRQAAVTTVNYEVQMTAGIVVIEVVGNGAKEESKPRPFKLGRVWHPKKQYPSLGVDVPEWYHRKSFRHQAEKR
jgi:hypothetical protein